MAETPAETVYVFVRTDLPLADQIVQAGHACLEAGSAFPLPACCRLIVLAAANREALCARLEFCRERGIRFRAFFEPDPVDGDIEPMGLAALCTEPVSHAQRRHFRRFRLWLARDP